MTVKLMPSDIVYVQDWKAMYEDHSFVKVDVGDLVWCQMSMTAPPYLHELYNGLAEVLVVTGNEVKVQILNGEKYHGKEAWYQLSQLTKLNPHD